RRCSTMSDRPVIALTLGDVAGIGPELVARVVSTPSVRAQSRSLVVGHPAVLRRALALIGETTEFTEVATSELTSLPTAEVLCWNPGTGDAELVPPGEVDPRAGR